MGTKKNGIKVWESKLSEVWEGWTEKSGVKCPGCYDVNNNNTLKRGEKVYKVFPRNYQGGITFCERCYKKSISDVPKIDKSYQSNGTSRNSDNFYMVVIARKEEKYYTNLGFKTSKYSPTHREYISEEQNNASKGVKIVEAAISNGDKISIINLKLATETVVSSASDFQKAIRMKVRG